MTFKTFDRTSFPLLHRHRRGCQFQERWQWGIQANSVWPLGNERPEHIVSWVQQLLAATESQSFPKGGNLIIDKQSPVVAEGFVFIICGRCDPVDIEVVELAIEYAIVSEVADFRHCIESINRSVPWRLSRITARSLAVTGNGDLCAIRIDAALAGNVTGARRYGTFVKSRNIGLNADIDCVIATARLRSLAGFSKVFRSADTYPLASSTACVGVIARKAQKYSELTTGNIAGRYTRVYSHITKVFGMFSSLCVERQDM